MDHLRVVLQVHKEHQLFQKYGKCEFSLRPVACEGIEFDPKNTKAVKNWNRPLTPTYIRSFLGLSRYYRSFVVGFASIAYTFIFL